MTQRVSAQIPHDLVQMAAIETHRNLGGELKANNLWIDSLDPTKLLGKRA
jgi:hypothetical protein